MSKISSWPSIPQFCIGDEFVGDCGIITELDSSVELEKLIAKAYPE